MQGEAAVKSEDHVRMQLRRSLLRTHKELARHAQMADEPALIENDENVFAAAFNTADAAPPQARSKLLRRKVLVDDGGVPHLHILDAPAQNLRPQTAADGFNFWQLRHQIFSISCQLKPALRSTLRGTLSLSASSMHSRTTRLSPSASSRETSKISSS